jgi:hypothetical protein
MLQHPRPIFNPKAKLITIALEETGEETGWETALFIARN